MPIKDIRDRRNLTGDEILALNFVCSNGPYQFRKYYRSGLRSLIFEVLSKDKLDRETNGIVKDGIRIFPRAVPEKIFRIFRTRFTDTQAIFNEIKKYNLLLKVLGDEFIARSEEFIVDYTATGEQQILLCGLQEYVYGEILDPWKIQDDSFLTLLYQSFPKIDLSVVTFSGIVEDKIRRFTRRIRTLINDYQRIPDLAGLGNLIVTPQGDLKLVDINNIVSIEYNNRISLDDKGYPACDVSVQVLFMLEEKLLGLQQSPDDKLYHTFMRNIRKTRVQELEKKFYENL